MLEHVHDALLAVETPAPALPIALSPSPESLTHLLIFININ